MAIQFGSRPLFKSDTLIAIGDIHGQDLKLESLLSKILPLAEGSHLVFCGDLINRGTNSPRVLDLMTEIWGKYPGQVFTIRGNHDWMLLSYVINGNKDWMQYIGKTLEQMKLEWNLPDTLPATICQALKDQGIWQWYYEQALPYYESEQVICTHAPLDYMTTHYMGGRDYAEDFETEKDDADFKYLLDRMRGELMWQFTDEDEKRIDNLVPKFKICGHQFKHHSQPRLFKMRAFIDTGCGCYPTRPLTALYYPSKKVVQSD